jgi:putative Mg2+ transporter-C (MgtC) family protein
MDADLVTQLLVIRDVAVAMLLGGVVGLERERAQKPAGLRTHTLVAGAAALFVGLGSGLVDAMPDASLQSDPVRIIEAVVTGISFLGAGTIFRHRGRNSVEGLTTASSLLFVGGLGIAAATHRWAIAVGAVVLALVVLRGLGRLEMALDRRGRSEGHDEKGPPSAPRARASTGGPTKGRVVTSRRASRRA